ncbi:hypothetical protein AVEN_203965-1 [Araneus ventricosus]|uniref:DNA helicase Pif1-like 2B domain-containing protein n=1 Tax=Araneus ventricosus TaxID=182803 RepID=A0A4Y2R8W6_ARAVE|nr:hypothetical protein AVEN_140475-1 [Araneus ventricosus]GBN71890.1 hypothetical protein AVEN_162186-1 [Araneus ventricosus]GBO10132.1 hypothetical protein AVEN_74503-1 [Araneus ventricosus]GBO10140.1 hypothetical protein AVEN_203965-1 [Araneus ventricosus]
MYESMYSVEEVEDDERYPIEFLHTLDPSGIPPHVLYLKPGTPIILIRNLKSFKTWQWHQASGENSAQTLNPSQDYRRCQSRRHL